MLDSALRYAGMGWPVLALAPGGKEPLTSFFPRGVLDATTDERVIRSIWHDCPDANLGIACQRFLVVDIDPRHKGDETMRDWVELYGRLPETPTAKTGGGGWHYLFQPVDFERNGKPGPGIDILQGNRFIVAAPSVTSSPYRWLRPPETPLATLPSWLQALIKRPEPPPRVPVGDIREVSLERRIERARAYLEHADPAISGQNGSTRTLVVAAHVALGFMLPTDHALAAMRDWNGRCQPPWSDRELKRKIDQALKGYRGVQPGQHLQK